MKKTPPQTLTAFRLDVRTLKRLQAIARLQRISLSALIRRELERFINEMSRRPYSRAVRGIGSRSEDGAVGGSPERSKP